nr:hypothetical protein [uncultured Pseudomonas sp.]
MFDSNGDILRRRLQEFESFRKERLPVLHKFAETLGFPDPHLILLKPAEFISGISDFFSNHVIEEDDRVWLLTRIGYFLGEFFICTYDGCWMVDEDAGSKTFSRHIVGDFSLVDKYGVDPFELAALYVDTPAPRSLKLQLDDFLTNNDWPIL